MTIISKQVESVKPTISYGFSVNNIINEKEQLEVNKITHKIDLLHQELWQYYCKNQNQLDLVASEFKQWIKLELPLWKMNITRNNMSIYCNCSFSSGYDNKIEIRFSKITNTYVSIKEISGMTLSCNSVNGIIPMSDYMSWKELITFTNICMIDDINILMTYSPEFKLKLSPYINRIDNLKNIDLCIKHDWSSNITYKYKLILLINKFPIKIGVLEKKKTKSALNVQLGELGLLLDCIEANQNNLTGRLIQQMTKTYEHKNKTNTKNKLLQ